MKKLLFTLFILTVTTLTVSRPRSFLGPSVWEWLLVAPGQKTSSVAPPIMEGMAARLSTAAAAQIEWVMGFLSAHNWHNANAGGPGDIASGTDLNGMLAWIDNYCAAHPLEKIVEATQALIVELSQRPA